MDKLTFTLERRSQKEMMNHIRTPNERLNVIRQQKNLNIDIIGKKGDDISPIMFTERTPHKNNYISKEF